MSDMSAEEQVMQLWQQALSGRSRKERQIAAHAFAAAGLVALGVLPSFS